jgi:hypothetical protein
MTLGLALGHQRLTNPDLKKPKAAGLGCFGFFGEA